MVTFFGNRLSFLEKTLIAAAIFTILAFFTPLGFLKIDASIILTATTVLFGVLAGFSLPLH